VEFTDEQLESALAWKRENDKGYRATAKRWSGAADRPTQRRFSAALQQRHRDNEATRDRARSRARAREAEQPADNAEEEEEEPGSPRALARTLKGRRQVAQKMIDAVEKALDNDEGVPGRTIAAMGTLLKTVSGFDERIAVLEAQQPKGPQTDADALDALRMSLEQWEDEALEMAFDVYAKRHGCRVEVEGDAGHRAVRAEGSWVRKAS
jgi:hypothetical protein